MSDLYKTAQSRGRRPAKKEVKVRKRGSLSDKDFLLDHTLIRLHWAFFSTRFDFWFSVFVSVSSSFNKKSANSAKPEPFYPLSQPQCLITLNTWSDCSSSAISQSDLSGTDFSKNPVSNPVSNFPSLILPCSLPNNFHSSLYSKLSPIFLYYYKSCITTL